MGRKSVLALVFMLVVSNLALVSHVTAHFQPQWAECELCVNHFQPVAALPSADHAIHVDRMATDAECVEPSEPVQTRPHNANPPRAPPIPFS
jgi:hypothetical protein